MDPAIRHMRELDYQEGRAASIGTVGPTPEEIFDRYRRSSWPRCFPKEMLFRSLGRLDGRNVLDFGCGEGELSTQMAKLGARVTGIDISPGLIDLAKRRAAADHVQDRTEFLVWDVLEKPLPEARFDLITGLAVLHHVNIPAILPVLWASLKPGGKAVMIEPLALSPFLRKLRSKVPFHGEASPVEHPLTRQELDLIVSGLGHARVHYYELFGRLHVLVHGRPQRPFLMFLGSIDWPLLALLPFLRRFAGECVIVATKGALQEGNG